MTAARFVGKVLCALMRESQHLVILLADKSFIVIYFMIGETGRRVL